jgi:hypothetical protein
MPVRFPRGWIAACCMALVLAACAPRDHAVAPGATAPGAEATLPPPVGPSAPDLSCQAASDCEVKNVGNCCGYQPACVNANARVDPDAVRAGCERSGMASVCGWKDIQSCECVANRCLAVDGPIAVER